MITTITGDRHFWVESRSRAALVTGRGGRRHRDYRIPPEQAASRGGQRAGTAAMRHMLAHLPKGPPEGPLVVEPYVGALVWSASTQRVHELVAHVRGPWWTLENGRTIDLLSRLRDGRMVICRSIVEVGDDSEA
jgi:hypothetical protein